MGLHILTLQLLLNNTIFFFKREITKLILYSVVSAEIEMLVFISCGDQVMIITSLVMSHGVRTIVWWWQWCYLAPQMAMPSRSPYSRTQPSLTTLSPKQPSVKYVPHVIAREAGDSLILNDTRSDRNIELSQEGLSQGGPWLLPPVLVLPNREERPRQATSTRC